MSTNFWEMSPNLKKIKKETVRMLNQDGIFDITLGLIFLFIGIVFLVQVAYKYEIPYGGVIIALPFILLFPELRKRVTFRRIGYVDMHTKQHGTLVAIGIFCVILALIILQEIFSIPLEYFRIIPFVVLGALAVCFLLYAKRYGIKRYALYAFAPLGGLVLLILPFGSLGLRFLYSFVLIGLCMISVGLVTLNRFKKSHPVLPENPEIRKDLSNKKRGFILFLQDGLDEIFLTINFIVWIIIYLTGKITLSWLLALILFVPPIVLGLLNSQIRKVYSKWKLEQNEVNKYVVTMSALRNGAVMFCINYIGYEIVTQAGLVYFFHPGSMWVASLVFIGFGCYYCIISSIYNVPRLLHIGTISFLCMFLYVLNISTFSRFIIYAAIMALVLAVNGIVSRIKFSQNISTEEVPDGK